MNDADLAALAEAYNATRVFGRGEWVNGDNCSLRAAGDDGSFAAAIFWREADRRFVRLARLHMPALLAAVREAERMAAELRAYQFAAGHLAPDDEALPEALR